MAVPVACVMEASVGVRACYSPFSLPFPLSTNMLQTLSHLLLSFIVIGFM
jgi:hypothetical protein